MYRIVSFFLTLLLCVCLVSFLRAQHTVEGKLTFNPVLFRLNYCGRPLTPSTQARGFWETFGFGIFGKSLPFSLCLLFFNKPQRINSALSSSDEHSLPIVVATNPKLEGKLNDMTLKD